MEKYRQDDGKAGINILHLMNEPPASQTFAESASSNPGDSELLFKGKFIQFKRAGVWEYVERCNVSGCVAILALTPNQEIILVEQFRIPVNRRVIELPAGLAGDTEGEEGESLPEAAKRELLEETGFVAGGMKYLAEGPSSAGITTEVITFFKALDVERAGDGGGDSSEQIQVHTVPFDHLESWLETKRSEGCLVDYKIQAALYFARTAHSE